MDTIEKMAKAMFPWKAQAETDAGIASAGAEIRELLSKAVVYKVPVEDEPDDVPDQVAQVDKALDDLEEALCRTAKYWKVYKCHNQETGITEWNILLEAKQ